jgi:NAD dependent epimerase/dehydratase family enzyme
VGQALATTEAVKMDFGTAISMTSAVMALLIPLGTLLAVILTRRSKAEDHKLAEDQQAFQQIYQLAEIRAGEIVRLANALVTARNDADARYDRQLFRCRKVTESLVAALEEVRKHPATAEAMAQQALSLLREHRSYEHGDDDESRSEGRS